jgi:hypothetical protein
LLNICLSVDTSKPKHPGEVPDFISYSVLPSSSTVRSIPKDSELDIIPLKSIQKSSGNVLASLQNYPVKKDSKYVEIFDYEHSTIGNIYVLPSNFTNDVC